MRGSAAERRLHQELQRIAPLGEVAGEACTSENECDTSLCISYNDGPQLCSMPCPEDGSDCPPAASACVFGLCVPPTP